MLQIEIEKFTLELPNVNKLGIKLLDNPYLNKDGQLVQMIYQTLSRDIEIGIDENNEPILQTVVVEEKNREVPAELTGLINKFITGTISSEEKAFVTQFVQQFNNKIIIK